jgi:hypothetical protein
LASVTIGSVIMRTGKLKIELIVSFSQELIVTLTLDDKINSCFTCSLMDDGAVKPMTEKDDTRVLKEFSVRLNEALDDIHAPNKHHGRQAYVGKLFGTTSNGARRWLNGIGLPRMKQATKIATKLNVRVEWLVFGVGPKRTNPEDAGSFNASLMQKIMVTLEKADRTGKIGLSEEHKALIVTSLYEVFLR